VALYYVLKFSAYQPKQRAHFIKESVYDKRINLFLMLSKPRNKKYQGCAEEEIMTGILHSYMYIKQSAINCQKVCCLTLLRTKKNGDQ
jgi:hypothetical protein